MPRRSIWAVTILCALTGAAPPLRAEPPSLFSGGDGLSKEHAVVIHAKREDDGNKVEYIWIRQNHPRG